MRELLRGTSTAASMRLLRTATSFALNVMLGRMLGADGVGLYFLAYAVVRIGAVIAQLGLARTVLRFCAADAAQGDWGRVRGAYRRALSMSTLLALAVTVLAWWQAGRLAALFSEPELATSLRYMCLGILPWTLVTLHSQFLLGLQRTRDALLVEGVAIPLVHIPMLAVLGGAYGLTGASGSFALSALAVLVLGRRLWKRAMPEGIVPVQFDTRDLLRSSLPLFWMDVTSVLIGITDTLILGIWRDASEVGIYTVARRVAVLTSAMLTAVNVVVAPKFAGMYRRGELDAISRLARRSAKLVTAVAAPYLLAVVLVPHWILGVFGPGFSAGSTALVLLAFGQFVAAATGSVGYLLIMTGHERSMRNNTILAAALSIVLQLVLIPRFGFVGAAAATSISSVVSNLVAMMLVWRYLSILTMPLPESLVARIAARFSVRRPVQETATGS
jgi:O-antigen/teichoic acid export membrane protein